MNKKIIIAVIVLNLWSVIFVEAVLDDGGDGFCQSIDVRFDLKNLQKFKDCIIVEGSVRLIMLSSATDGDEWNNYTFPLLTEITGNLMIYKVDGLSSLSQLFPNLAVIRGNVMYNNFSLTVSQCADLSDLGLSNLTTISQGGIQISKNPILCYVNTINWPSIVHKDYLQFNMIQQNGNICPSCSKGSKYCWSHDISQLICKCNGNACSPSGKCCDANCLGGCDDNDPKECKSCRNFRVGNSSKCVSSCPLLSSVSKDNRCITFDECNKLNENSAFALPFIAFEGKCQQGCGNANLVERLFYKNGRRTYTCIKCEGYHCYKKCTSKLIKDIDDAQSLKGCQVIEGALEIRLSLGVNNTGIVRVLEESLSNVIEINDYFKIVRSYHLVSLRFLKNLKRIGGYRLDNKNYSVVILDNENLSQLWDENQNVKIENGKLLIQFNPKLCFKDIDRLRSNTILLDSYEMSKLTNSARAQCNMLPINASVANIFHNWALVQWQPISLDDTNFTLAYVVNYKEAPNQDVNIYESRDACSEDGWLSEDIFDFSHRFLTTFKITALKSYTQYAYYLKAYTLSLDKAGAQSEVQYFRTLPGIPEVVQNAKIDSSTPSEITVSWEAPINMNGEFDHYEIKYRHMNFEGTLRDRDFCVEPVTGAEEDDQSDLDANDEIQDYFDSIQIKNENQGRSKRYLYGNSFPGKLDDSMEAQRSARTRIVETKGKSIVLRNLDKFTSYGITLRACIKKNGSDYDYLCGMEKLIPGKTLRDDNVDRVKQLTAEIILTNSSYDVQLSWFQPELPNGAILSYNIRYKRVDISNFKGSKSICIPNRNYHANSSHLHYRIASMPSGNYSFQVSAQSLAGFSKLTDPVFVYIPSEDTGSFFFIGLIAAFIVFVLAAIGFLVYKKMIVPKGQTQNSFENMSYREEQLIIPDPDADQ